MNKVWFDEAWEDESIFSPAGDSMSEERGGEALSFLFSGLW